MFGLEERSLLRFLFFLHLPLFVQAGGLVDPTRGIVVQSRTEIFFFSPRFPIFTKRTQTLCCRSCTHQIFHVIARHFSHISCCFYFIFYLVGRTNMHFGVLALHVNRLFQHFSLPTGGALSLQHFLKVLWTNNLLREEKHDFGGRNLFLSRHLLYCVACYCALLVRVALQLTDSLTQFARLCRPARFSTHDPLQSFLQGQLNIVTELERIGFLERCKTPRVLLCATGRTRSDLLVDKLAWFSGSDSRKQDVFFLFF